jgi:hypothetical protein
MQATGATRAVERLSEADQTDRQSGTEMLRDVASTEGHGHILYLSSDAGIVVFVSGIIV